MLYSSISYWYFLQKQIELIHSLSVNENFHYRLNSLISVIVINKSMDKSDICCILGVWKIYFPLKKKNFACSILTITLVIVSNNYYKKMQFEKNRIFFYSAESLLFILLTILLSKNLPFVIPVFAFFILQGSFCAVI